MPTGGEHSPLLNPESSALNDATLASPGLIAREVALDEELNYGTLTSNAEENDSGEPSEIKSRQLTVIIASMYVGSFLAALDTTIVTTLLSTIASELNCVSKMSWIATSYLLSCSAFQPLYGKISDIFGRRPLLIFSNASFALGCLICGISTSLTTLSIGRFVTGIGGGGLTSLATITTSDLVPLRKRGIYQGFGNIAFGLGAGMGGIYGALFQKYAGWQFAFLSQVPISLLGGFLIWKYLVLPKGSIGLGIKGSKTEKLKQVDFLGAGLLVSSLLSFMVLVSFAGHEISINGLIFWALIILTSVSLVAFGYVELYIAVQPVIPVRLLANRTVLSSSLVNWFNTMAVFTYLYYVPVFWSSVVRLSPTEIGFRTVSNFVGVSIGSFSSGLYMKKTGRYLYFSIITGAITVVGISSIYLAPTSSPVVWQYVELFIPGYGYAASLTVTLLALIAAVPHEHQAATTSIQYAFRATGSTIGVSIASFIFQRNLLKSLTERLYSIPSDFTNEQIQKIIERSVNSAEYTWIAPKIFRGAILESYDISTHSALSFSLATCTVAWIIGFFMKEHILHTSINRK